MNCLNWNCRGIKKTGVSTFLRDLILDYKFHLIGLQETMQMDIADNILREIDPSKTCLWKRLPSNGRSGGILRGVNIDMYAVCSFKEVKYIRQMNLWDKTLKIKWNFMNVYGAAQEENKTEFFAELASFCSSSKEPYVVGGDFNVIRFTTEKNNDTGLSRFSDIFNSIIASQELIDLQMAAGGTLGQIIKLILRS